MNHLHFTQSLEPLEGGGLAAQPEAGIRELPRVHLVFRLPGGFARGPRYGWVGRLAPRWHCGSKDIVLGLETAWQPVKPGGDE